MFGWGIQGEPDYPWLINVYRLEIQSIGTIGKRVVEEYLLNFEQSV